MSVSKNMNDESVHTPGASYRLTRSHDPCLSCLEATSQWFTWVNKCSQCTYYENHSQHSKVIAKKKWSELGKAWHCSTIHDIHDLTSNLLSLTTTNATISDHHNYVMSSSNTKNVPPTIHWVVTIRDGRWWKKKLSIIYSLSSENALLKAKNNSLQKKVDEIGKEKETSLRVATF